MRGRYGVIVSRGVGRLHQWLPAALMLLQGGGRLILEKGPTALAEIQTLADVLSAHRGVSMDFMPVAGESSRVRTMVVIGMPDSGQKVDKDG